MLAQQPSAGWVRRDRTEQSDDNADFDEFMSAQWAPLFRTAYLLTGDYQLAGTCSRRRSPRFFCPGQRSRRWDNRRHTPARS